MSSNPSPDYAALPARELDALVLIRLFGWRWAHHGPSPKRVLYSLIPPKGTDWRPMPDGPNVWHRMSADFMPRETERFDEWWRACVKTISRGHWLSEAPGPSTDPAAMMQVIEAMQSRFVYFDLKWDAGSDWRAQFFAGTAGMVARYADTPGRAVCLAALAALAPASPAAGKERAK